MKVCIAGGGRVGMYLAQSLLSHRHKVTIIEPQESLCRTLADTLDIPVVCGDSLSFDTLRRGGVENCDAVAAVTEEDSVNLMAAQLAKNIFRRDKVICRVSDPHLQILYHKAYELETICPTVLTEQAVFRALSK